MVFGAFDFLQKTNKRIRLYYYDTSSRLAFDRFLEEIQDTKKSFRNYFKNVDLKTQNFSPLIERVLAGVS